MDEDEKIRQIQEKWRLVYDQGIPDKIKRLESLIQQFEKDKKLNTLSEFRREVHNIAGGAGTVGYMSVSVLCKKFDKELLEKMEKFKPEPEWIGEFYAYLNRIREGFSSVDV